MSTYAKTYAPTFHGMPSHRHWPTSQFHKPLPPPFRNMLGRPTKNKQKLEFDEGRDAKNKKKKKKKKKKKFVERHSSKTSVRNVEGLAITRRLARTQPNQMRHPLVQHQLKEENQKSILVLLHQLHHYPYNNSNHN